MVEIPHEWLDGIVGVLESMNQGVLINNDCGEVVFANSLALKMVGLTADKFVGAKVVELFPPEDAKKMQAQIERRRREGSNLFEFYLPHSGGGRTPVVITARQIEDPDGAIYSIVTLTDISAQKRAEDELREVNVKLEQRVTERTAELEASNMRLTQSEQGRSLALAAGQMGSWEWEVGSTELKWDEG